MLVDERGLKIATIDNIHTVLHQVLNLAVEDDYLRNNPANHTLVYYNHAENGCYFGVNTPKTKAGQKVIPMTEIVKEAFQIEKAYQELHHISSRVQIDGYTNFVFINRFGNVQNQGTLWQNGERDRA